MMTILSSLNGARIQPVRHGTFIGLRGNLAQLSPDLWAQVVEAEPWLLRRLPDDPTPFTVRQAAIAAGKGAGR